MKYYGIAAMFECFKSKSERVVEPKKNQEIRVYGEFRDLFNPFVPWETKYPTKDIPIKDAIQMLMDNAGFKFEFTKAQESKVILKKKVIQDKQSKLMKEIIFRTWPAKSKEIVKLFDELGIKYEEQYIPSSVPCQTECKIIAKPRNQLEAYAVFGIIG